jgi:ADP-heptose:LPS heptosyltransferase
LFDEGIPWTVAGNPETLSLLHNRFYAQEIVSIHQKEWAWLFQEENAIPEPFRNYLSSFQKAYLFSTNQPEVMIRGLKQAGLEKVFWIPSLPDVRKKVPLQTRQREILESENIPWITAGKYIFPARGDLEEARKYLSRPLKVKGGQSIWAIHPGSGSSHKNWPLERFLETAEKLRGRNQVLPIFLLGPVEQEPGEISNSVIQGRGFPIIQELPLPLMAGVLSHCSGYLGNDSGVSHLAAAVGIPTVVLFGPTDPSFWSPRGSAVRILSPDRSCAPCTREIMQNCPTKECLASLTVPQVLEVLQSFSP